jgi:hypothetical protein
MITRLAILIALYLASGLSQEGNSRKLLGKWRSVETSKGGIGATVNFRGGGIFDYSPGAIVGGTYRVEQNRLITTYENGDPETSMSIQSLTADTLQLGPPSDAPVRQGAGLLDFRRIGRPNDPNDLLLGAWVTVAIMPGMPSHGYYYFRRDGTETFNIPFRTDHCTYALAGDRIRLSIAGRGSVEGQVRWEGDVLVLPWGRGEAKFKRF